MKYVETDSGAIIYIPSFIKSGLRVRKLIRGINRQHGNRTSLRKVG
jgi:hypothetical protein